MGRLMNARIGIILVPLIGIFLFFQNCSPAKFQENNTTDNASSANGPLPAPPLDDAPPITVQSIKPALAVRGMACMLCHAQINANIITDFGAGDSQFFANQFPAKVFGSTPAVVDARPLTLPWYGNYYGAWQTAKISGKVYVPQISISDARLLGSANSPNPISLKELMSLDLGAGYYGIDPYLGYTGTGAMDSNVEPKAGESKIEEIKSLYIGAPTKDQLLSLATKSLSTMASGWEAVTPGSSISGLVSLTGVNGSPFVTHAGTDITCIGDIVVKGTLYLSNVRIRTDEKGCRLMVTESVFIDGQILFPTKASTENLQISSARAIVMGISMDHLQGTSRVTGRLTTDRMNVSIPLTRGAGTNLEKNNAILQEATNLGSRLHDSTEAAACPTVMHTYQADPSYGKIITLNHCLINYERLVLNAPQVHSRYVGSFKGVVIAELALFAPGALQFNYDNVFDAVDILPKVKDSVLRLSY